jgi:hypothetical protein
MNVSNEYALIFNLIQSAKWHRENCHSNCNVSIRMIKEAALKLMVGVKDSEYIELVQLIEDTDWT